jgi:cephalosporin hydroxylase
MLTILLVLTAVCSSLFSYSAADVERLKGEVVSARSTIYGWCTPEKLMNFIDLTLEVKPDLCVEIGPYGGASFLPVAYTLKFLGSGMAIAIDPWDFVECIRHLDPIEHEKSWRTWLSIPMDVVDADFQNLIRRYRLEDYTITLRMTSEKAASQIEDGSIDILHIDGDHSEYGSTMDAKLYLPKVRPGGYIWLTDALWKERGDAVDLLLESCDVVKMIDDNTCFLFKKRDNQ